MADHEPDLVLLKDIVIPAGTVLRSAPQHTQRVGEGHYSCTVGLDPNSSGTFEYYVSDLSENAYHQHFTTLKG